MRWEAARARAVCPIRPVSTVIVRAATRLSARSVVDTFVSTPTGGFRTTARRTGGAAVPPRDRPGSRLPTQRHVVALTFDAGAGAGGVAKILAAPRSKDAPATFFMTGRFAELFPDLARQNRRRLSDR